MAVPKSRPAGRRRSSQEAAAADFREAAAADFREAAAADFREAAAAVIQAGEGSDHRAADQRAADHARAIS